jgi:hypothetical protein
MGLSSDLYASPSSLIDMSPKHSNLAWFRESNFLLLKGSSELYALWMYALWMN